MQISSDYSIKVSEYGFHRSAMAVKLRRKNVIRDPRYSAPELLQATKVSDELACDVYSFGIVCFELFTRKRAFEEEENATVLGLKLALQTIPLEFPEYIPTSLKCLILDCINPNISARPKPLALRKALKELKM